jgi:hypothetical protein
LLLIVCLTFYILHLKQDSINFSKVFEETNNFNYFNLYHLCNEATDCCLVHDIPPLTENILFRVNVRKDFKLKLRTDLSKVEDYFPDEV